MFFSKNQSSELFLDLSEEQQETVAGGKVYEQLMFPKMII